MCQRRGELRKRVLEDAILRDEEDGERLVFVRGEGAAGGWDKLVKEEEKGTFVKEQEQPFFFFCFRFLSGVVFHCLSRRAVFLAALSSAFRPGSAVLAATTMKDNEESERSWQAGV